MCFCGVLLPDAQITADNPDGILNAAGTPITAVTDEKGKATFYIMVTSKDKDLHYTYSVSAEGFHSKDVAEPVYKVFTLNNMDSGDTPYVLSFKLEEKVSQVELGCYHSAAITENGRLYTWGYNYGGQLGDGTTTGSPTPMKIMDNVASVSLGKYHSAAITADGSLYMWGNNDYGQLGNGMKGSYDERFDEEIDSVIPIKIMDNVASVSLGEYHSAAITTDGSLYMWGRNYFSRLGKRKRNGVPR